MKRQRNQSKISLTRKRFSVWFLLASICWHLASGLANFRAPQNRLHFWDKNPLGVLRMSALSDDEEGGQQSFDLTQNQEVDDFCEVTDEFGCRAYEEYCDSDCGDDFRWIRLEKELPKDLERFTTVEQVRRKIKDVRELQGKHGPSNLYGRKWNEKKSTLSREDTNCAFTIAQFNTLAEGLASGNGEKTPFQIDSKNKRCQKDEKSSYGGFTSLPFPDITLNFQLRRWRILEVLLECGESGPCDILAMEEVDRYRGFFAPMLKLFGFDGIFMPKARAPGVRMGWYSDGCALFWKNAVFELVSESRRKFSEGNQVMMDVVLRHRATGKSVVVGVTHLKASNSETNEQIRAKQVEELLKCVEDTIEKIKEKEEVDDVPALIVGDFNAEPPSKVPYAEESAVEKALRPSTLKEYRSAYEIDPPADDFYTTLKVRGDDTYNRIIDYIFYRGKLELCSNLQIPPESELENSKLPGLRYPSDHLLIAAKFRLLDK